MNKRINTHSRVMSALFLGVAIGAAIMLGVTNLVFSVL